ncbi:MAG TPA: CBS domain-containing protein [Casimicrobiaceae bacterium]|nr:CBS domain-containing protein [Casimicrobiaceae bacterium]
MKARDVMTHCVVTVAPEAPIGEAIARMISHQVSGMPVVDAEGRLVGIVSEADFLRRQELHTEAPRRRWLEMLLGPGSPAEEYSRSHGLTVAQVMSREVIHVTPDTSLTDIVALMDEHSIKRVPVVEEGRVAGIVTRADLMSAVAAALGERKPLTDADAAVREKVVREMKKQTWCPMHGIDVIVRGGVVTLKGTIFDERQRRALHVLVENTPGAKSIRDSLVLIDPNTGVAVERNGAATRS